MLSVSEQPDLNFTQWYAQDPQIWYNFLINLKDNFEGLYDYYMRWKWDVPQNQNPSSAQHQAMAQHYRNIIKQTIQEFDNTQTNEVYEALSWTGLMGTGIYDSTTGLFSESTVAWSNLLQSERFNIINKINNFNNSNQNCQ